MTATLDVSEDQLHDPFLCVTVIRFVECLQVSVHSGLEQR